MSKFQLLLTLFQFFGPVMKEAWPVLQELFNILKNAPQPPRKPILGRARMMARPEKVDEAQKQELMRLAEEHGVDTKELEESLS
jgi:hypothetical protein